MFKSDASHSRVWLNRSRRDRRARYAGALECCLGLPVPGEAALLSAAIYAGTKHDLNIVDVILTAAGAEEWNCGWNLLNLHDCNSRIRLLEAKPSSDEGLNELRTQAEELRERLRNNAHFLGLRHQQSLLNGQTAYLYPLEDLLEKAGLEKETTDF
jgi:hypothetical protein